MISLPSADSEASDFKGYLYFFYGSRNKIMVSIYSFNFSSFIFHHLLLLTIYLMLRHCPIRVNCTWVKLILPDLLKNLWFSAFDQTDPILNQIKLLNNTWGFNLMYLNIIKNYYFFLNYYLFCLLESWSIHCNSY